MVLLIYSSINLIESIYQLLRSTKDFDYIYPRNFANKKLKDIIWKKKFNKLVPLSESKLEFRTQNLCKDHLFHTHGHYSLHFYAWQFQYRIHRY